MFGAFPILVADSAHTYHHAHPKVSKAAAGKCMQILHSQCSIALQKLYLRLIERLLAIMPNRSFDSFVFWSSGSEAFEAAIKMTRWFESVICMQGACISRRAFNAMAVTTGKTIHSAGSHTFLVSLPIPLSPRLIDNTHTTLTSPATLSSAVLYQLDLGQQPALANTLALFIVPGAWRVAGWVCKDGGGFAVAESGVGSDILVISKWLGRWLLLSGVVSRCELTDTLAPGSMGDTYSSNDIAANEEMCEENIMQSMNNRSYEPFDCSITIPSQTAHGQLITRTRIGLKFPLQVVLEVKWRRREASQKDGFLVYRQGHAQPDDERHPDLATAFGFPLVRNAPDALEDPSSKAQTITPLAIPPLPRPRPHLLRRLRIGMAMCKRSATTSATESAVPYASSPQAGACIV
ncbi:hypothetical protein GALMADRAFT_137542 [Galerina marginata CBS 339.88]|uniref:Uncharacterized protein n=1 Tax=Galerina marginata (strain CBS 339.88) TaxID=685588 RepID=A0A067T5U6_GALM3|nr:hypothetical protein GALMADRAFT_137542 [Galerina marginata CBS 339.88]